MSQKSTIEYNPFERYDHFILVGREGNRLSHNRSAIVQLRPKTEARSAKVLRYNGDAA
jgi:hypothetical protein